MYIRILDMNKICKKSVLPYRLRSAFTPILLLFLNTSYFFCCSAIIEEKIYISFPLYSWNFSFDWISVVGIQGIFYVCCVYLCNKVHNLPGKYSITTALTLVIRQIVMPCLVTQRWRPFVPLFGNVVFIIIKEQGITPEKFVWTL